MADHAIKLLQEMRAENTQRFDAIDQRFTNIDRHLISIDHRFNVIETKLTEHDQYFTRLVQLISDLQA